MKVCMLSSSSKGNSTLIWDDNTKILVDVGLNLKDIEMKLNILSVDPNDISAILITHEHSDHIKGLGPFIRKYHKRVYIHADDVDIVLSKIGKIDKNLVIEFFNSDFYINDFRIHSFKLPHDSVCCVGYTIRQNEKQVSIMTDLGHTNADIIKNLYGSRLVLLEANHDEKMLRANPKYSFALKNRIMGKFGHLSNKASAEIIADLACHGVKQVMLAHLSEENNTPEFCYDYICKYLENMGVIAGKNIMIDIAKAHEISTLFTLK